MPQKCPNCKRKFAGDDIFCEDCGVSLVPVSSAWRKWAILSAGVVLVFAAVWCGVSYIADSIGDNIVVRSTGGLSPDANKKEVEQDISIENRSMADVTVVSIDCSSEYDDWKLTCNPIAKTAIAKGGQQVIRLSASVDRNQGSELVIPTGTISARVWGFPVHHSFNLPNLGSSNTRVFSGIIHPNQDIQGSVSDVSQMQLSQQKNQSRLAGNPPEPESPLKGQHSQDWSGPIVREHGNKSLGGEAKRLAERAAQKAQQEGKQQ